MSDEITITIPRERDFYRVAHLVVGGLAVRLDLTFEHLEDLQIAVAGLLGGEGDGIGDVTVAVRIEGEELATAVGPIEHESFRAELENGGDGIGIRRILDTVCDSVDLVEREGAPWVELRKTIRREG